MLKKDTKPVTKDDVKQIVTEIITESVGELAVMIKKSFDDVNKKFKKIDGQLAINSIEHKNIYEYIDKSAEETQRHFDVVAENIHVDVAKANKDEIQSIKRRVAVLEEKVGV